MVIKNIEENSKYLQSIFDLSDKNTKTLGFLPYDAIREQAKKKRIFGVIDINDNLMGYLLYRISNNYVTIVHLCIDENFRNLGVAKMLINKLKEFSKPFLGIKLKCRQDYEANKVWPKFNFQPINELKGRSKEGHLLTVWYFGNNHPSLLSNLYEIKTKNRILVAIDMNIFLDLKEKRERESLALYSDWLEEEIELCITHELFNEIYKNENPLTRKKSRIFANNFTQLEFNENKFLEVYKILKTNFVEKNINDESDLKQIANAIVANLQYFITRDNYWIEQNDFFEDNFNITILRPSSFITYFDELIQNKKYHPIKIAGSKLKSEYVTKDKIEDICNIFYFNEKSKQEKKTEFQVKIREYLSYPDKYKIQIISDNNNYIALIVYDFSKKSKISIPILRFTNTQLKINLAKHLLFKSILKNSNSNYVLEITDEYLNFELEKVFLELNFNYIDNKWTRFFINEICELNLLSNILEKIISELPEYKIFLENIIIKIKNYNLVDDKNSIYNLERLFSPLKISDLDIECYVVSIQPHWASELFEENISKQKLLLFSTEENLVLNTQNVYYRSAKNKILTAPSRIMWYISNDSSNKHIQNKKCISAISYIDEIYIDKPKKLFKKFNKLGIFQWKDIYQTANENIENEIMAFVFSDSELLNNVINLKDIKNIYTKHTGKNYMILSPIKIDSSLFIELYKLGKNYENR